MRSDDRGALHTEVLPEGHPDRLRVLQMSLDLADRPSSDLAVAIHDLPSHDALTSVQTALRRSGLAIGPLVGAYAGDRLLSGAFAVLSPGKAALIFAPSFPCSGIEREAVRHALRSVRELAFESGVQLLQVLIPPDAAALAEGLGSAGYTYLTRLLYLSRDARLTPPHLRGGSGAQFHAYRPELHGLFLSAVERSYVGTRDCPALVGLRSTDDVLSGHRATGIYDPRLWFVALRGARADGVLLLTRLGSEPAVEIVYLGVAQPARGTGLADELVARAVETCREDSATHLTLAVDRENVPARRLYERWGFAKCAARDAWIASTTGC
jgi:ribosomal protein S18 acetylase RimI-like enzyme